MLLKKSGNLRIMIEIEKFIEKLCNFNKILLFFTVELLFNIFQLFIIPF